MARIKNLSRKLRSASLRQIAAETKAPGEFGRAIPGIDQAAINTGVNFLTNTPGGPAIPSVVGRTDISTYLTKPSGDHLLYQAEGWVKVTLILESVGPVDVGTRDQISPIGSGKGIGLPQNVLVDFPLVKGDRLIITSTAVNRVRFIISPIPWLEQITTMLGSVLEMGGKFFNVFNQKRGQ